MDLSLAFSNSTPLGLPDRTRRRAACFVLRMVLGNPELCAGYMQDPENLLRLLGKGVYWPAEIVRAIDAALRETDLGEQLPQDSGSDAEDAFLIAHLKGRQGWTTYEAAIARLWAERPKVIRGALEDNLARLEHRSLLESPGNANILLVSKLLGLSAVESRLLDFAEARTHGLFRGFLRAITGFAPDDAYDLMATAIDTPVADVRKALRANAPLRSYGLVALDSSPADMEDFLQLDTTGNTFLSEAFATADDMLRVILQPGQGSELAVADFPHLEREFGLLVTYLRNVSKGHLKGANLVFYGPPGTGKTEFARLLAEEAGLTPFEVKAADNEGQPVSARTRLTNFALSQRFLAERGETLVLFDEIEDVFPETALGISSLFDGTPSGSRLEQPKAWLNQQLESSPVPAIWICNSIDTFDDACLRRFAFHVEFRVPPRAVRERIVRRCLQSDAVADELVASLAADDSLSPAQIDQASRFARLSSATRMIDESALMQAINASQAAMGRHHRVGSSLPDAAPCNFAYLNLDTEIPLKKIEQALCRLPAATLCFHGISGAGKTSLARHLAETVGRPLLQRRASDLLGMYLGESEKRIARMFRDARHEGAVLLLDEADSLLRSRSRAHRSWEVTVVNELLQQVEAHDGIFICATNLMDDVDVAALRRFTFKIRFDPLTEDQCTAIFSEMVLNKPATILPLEMHRALKKLHPLTPGDFATVRRQEMLLGERYSPAEFLDQLKRECAMKQGRESMSIGFQQ